MSESDIRPGSRGGCDPVPPPGRTRRLLRGSARRVALDALSVHQRARGRLDEALQRPRIALPYLHAVPRRREHVLRDLLLQLSPTHEFIGYGEAIRRIHHGPIDRPYAAFSFDDGFASNARAARILEEFGATGCFFVPPAFVGVPTVAGARRFFGFRQGVDEPAMTWDDLERLKTAGHEIGNHTMNHRVLSELGDDEVADEIGSAADVLRSRLGESTHFAWPRGTFDHMTDEAARLVFRTGHESCASAVRGVHTVVAPGPKESVCVRRDHVMVEWPLRQIRYFLAVSSERSGRTDNDWPDGWRVVS